MHPPNVRPMTASPTHVIQERLGRQSEDRNEENPPEGMITQVAGKAAPAAAPANDTALRIRPSFQSISPRTANTAVANGGTESGTGPGTESGTGNGKRDGSDIVKLGGPADVRAIFTRARHFDFDPPFAGDPWDDRPTLGPNVSRFPSAIPAGQRGGLVARCGECFQFLRVVGLIDPLEPIRWHIDRPRRQQRPLFSRRMTALPQA